MTTNVKINPTNYRGTLREIDLLTTQALYLSFQDIEILQHKLDFTSRQDSQDSSILVENQVNLVLGAESTVSMCNSSSPCENGGTCTDVFFNDFR